MPVVVHVSGSDRAPGRLGFDAVLRRHGLPALTRRAVTIVQVNVGKLCNQACHHCHVDAGPGRTEIMQPETVARVIALLERSEGVETVDVTGGAPELNPSFRDLVREARALGLDVVDRCNLTVLLEPSTTHLAEFLAAHRVHLICSLPCYTAANVDAQRGGGVFDRSIEALRRLNGLGYGLAGSRLRLDLVYNPVGAFLPPSQSELADRYHEELDRLFGVRFHDLLTITNMPIKRFADRLQRSGEHAAYMGLLVNHFNPATVPGLMCRSLVSVGWQGSLYDCDFNQMLEIPLRVRGTPLHLADLGSFDELAGLEISTASHCFGCTAGSGSSCSGALAG